VLVGRQICNYFSHLCILPEIRPVQVVKELVGGDWATHLTGAGHCSASSWKAREPDGIVFMLYLVVTVSAKKMESHLGDIHEQLTPSLV